MPVRSCIVCRKKNEKANLLRIVTDSNNNSVLDCNQKINSRAIYICNDRKCLEHCLKLLEKNKLKTKIKINNDSLKIVIESIL